TATNQPPATSAAPTLVEAPISAPKPFASTNVPEQLLVLTNDNARYTFTTHGGGLKLIELRKYLENVCPRGQTVTETDRVVTLNTFTRAPTLALLDGEALQGDGVFSLTRLPNGVRAEKTLSNGLNILKDFTLDTNFLLSANVQLRNTATQ